MRSPGLAPNESVHPGVTKNISSSGVLFTAGAQPDLGGPIEYVITLNHEGTQSVNLRCVGKVLRSESGTGASGLKPVVSNCRYIGALRVRPRIRTSIIRDPGLLRRALSLYLSKEKAKARMEELSLVSPETRPWKPWCPSSKRLTGNRTRRSGRSTISLPRTACSGYPGRPYPRLRAALEKRGIARLYSTRPSLRADRGRHAMS